MRVNGVAPGLVDTEMWESTFERLGEDAVRSGFAKRVPMDRWGTADEIKAKLQAHIDQGAGQVVIQPIRPDCQPGPDWKALEALAPG